MADDEGLQGGREYPLPATDVSAAVREWLHPWIAGFIGRTPVEATQRLHDRWSTIDRPSLDALRQTLSEFEVRSIVIEHAGGMIYAARPNSDEGVIGNSFLLPAPIDAEVLSDRLESVGLSGNAAVREFMLHFAGLAESTTSAGHFVYDDSPWPRLSRFRWGPIKGFENWEGSLMIYYALNGGRVLVHPNGKVAWWILQEHLVEEFAGDFDDFVRQFSEHRKIAWPYDPYGPPDDIDDLLSQ